MFMGFKLTHIKWAFFGVIGLSLLINLSSFSLPSLTPPTAPPPEEAPEVKQAAKPSVRAAPVEVRPVQQANFVGDDQVNILGRWVNPLTNAAYLEFREDGTFRDVAILESTEGKYRFIDHQTMEMTSPGQLYGVDAILVKYRINGDTLELLDRVKYRRAK